MEYGDLNSLRLKAWKEWQKCDPEDCMNSKKDNVGEIFQLIGASIIYSSNALNSIRGNELHNPIREVFNNRNPWKDISKLTMPPSLFVEDSKHLKIFGTFSLASSSFRLDTAFGLIDNNKWSKGKLAKCSILDSTKDLGCFKDRDGKLSSFDLKNFAMVKAHRDEFGHGEQGKDNHYWSKERGNCFETYYVCRLLQAQFLLIIELSCRLKNILDEDTNKRT